MNLPLPFTALAVTGEQSDETDVLIYLNRSGINSIEVPPENAHVLMGGALKVKFLNRGAPIHITTTSSNAGMFTEFFHENMYVVDEKNLVIPLKRESPPGFFDIEIIAGYGVMKASMRVEVNVKPSRGEPEPQKEVPPQPVAHGRPHILMVMMGIALILYSSWYYTNLEVLNSVAFIALIVGVLYVWYRQK
ncbi:MAG: hypothetical protein WC391_02650 [Methanoregula sp.]|jgi:hypothetical protein